MSKVQTIRISNFKSIEDFAADFQGCTAIITGGNNKGKTSFLRGIPDRIRFIRPDVLVKTGEKEGKGEMTLTTGEKFVWEFDTFGKDKLTYITDKGIKRSVTMELGAQFFPATFDIDKFLQSPPKKQVEQLQAIVGLDFADVDKRYLEAYGIRTEKNRQAEIYHVKLSRLLKCDQVDAVDLTELKTRKEAERARLNSLYLENKKANDKKRTEWELEKLKIDSQVKEYNDIQAAIKIRFDGATDALGILKACGYKGKEVQLFLDEFKSVMTPDRIAAESYPPEPTYIAEMPDDSDLQKIDTDIFEASQTNAKAAKYTEWVQLKEQTKAAKDEADQADLDVKAIEQERLKMIDGVTFPKGVAITPDGITIDGLPLDRNQLSTSKLYTAALRIASMNLGEVKTLYFDASFLDRNSLAEIEAWAVHNDLQLLIERPDFDGGEISYTLIENQP